MNDKEYNKLSSKHLFLCICNYCLEEKYCRYVIIPIATKLKDLYIKESIDILDIINDRIKISVCEDCIPANTFDFKLILA